MVKTSIVLFLALLICKYFSGPLSNTAEELASTVTSNSTQTPSDLSPTPASDDNLPQAHHQNPGHCMASFAAINQMRQTAQV